MLHLSRLARRGDLRPTESIRGRTVVCTVCCTTMVSPAPRAAGLPLLLLALLGSSTALGNEDYHPWWGSRPIPRGDQLQAETDADYWTEGGRVEVEERTRRTTNLGAARNVVLFLGDGMSVPTLGAARALLGQRAGRSGEEFSLYFENFPTVGLAKTYCLDAQVADSACTATAYLCGVKNNMGTIGVTGAVPRGECGPATLPQNQVASIAEWALRAGRDAGLVTTTRVTHASPAGAFAHTADRDWESDADLPARCQQSDIAHQLIHSYPGNQFKVILGGGRREFLPNTTVDEEGTVGRRLDGRNLIEEWQADKCERDMDHRYVWSGEQLARAMDPTPPAYLLGLFEGSHMQYHMLAEGKGAEPTLADMTEAAIRVLSRNDNGFFLFVEGGRIDHAHHENKVQLALDETLELATAVERASRLLDERDSLLVVTADHAHVMAYSGYTARGSDILGPSGDLGDDGLPYMTLSYTNGPGYRPHQLGTRANLTDEPTFGEVEWRSHAEVPLQSETHGGEDVAVFARGPHHHLFTGLYEQHLLPHLMAYAACVHPATALSTSPHCRKGPA